MADNSAERAPRRLRADAARNIDSLLEAAKAVFATSGVDAPAKEIADLAGVGVGTLYRHFPQRSDLVKAVFQREVDACADAAPALAAANEPAAALARWLHRYTEFLATKRGLAAALHSGDPAFDALPGYFAARLEPALGHCSRRRRPAARSGPTSARGSSCTPWPRCACRSRATASPTASGWWRCSWTDCATARWRVSWPLRGGATVRSDQGILIIDLSAAHSLSADENAGATGRSDQGFLVSILRYWLTDDRAWFTARPA